jgi:hypothetical protein
VEAEPLHPGEVLRSLRDGFSRRVVVVQGRLRRSDRAYRNGFYHSLLGQEGESLTLLTPPALDARLPRDDHHQVTVRGYLEFSLMDSRIQPLVVLSEVLHSQAAEVPDPRLALLERLARKARKDVPTLLRRAILSGERPRLLLIYAYEGVVDHDLERALGDRRAAYQIEEHRIRFVPEALASHLEQMDLRDYTAIGIVRGGGSGLEVCDHPRLVEAVLSMRTPFIAAIGHAKDQTLVAAAADWRVETPSLLGTRLRELAGPEAPQQAAETQARRPGVPWELWLWRIAALAALLYLLWRQL